MGHALQLLALLAIIIASAKLAGAASARIGQPAVFGEILVGLLLGPTLCNILAWPLFLSGSGLHESPGLLAIIKDLADIGVILLMFIAGLETDLDDMRRVGTLAFWTAAGGVALPLAGGTMVAAAYGIPVRWEGLFIGTILTATSVSISAQTLMELGAIRSRAGATILGAAVIDDVMGILLLSVVVALAGTQASNSVAGIGIVVVRMLAFFAVAIAAGRWLPRVGGWAEGLGVSQGLLAFVVVLTFVYAWAAEAVGAVAPITGAYICGVLFGRTPFKGKIDAGIHPLTYSVFVPVFFVSIGLQANGRSLGSQWAFTVALVLVAIVTKVAGCGIVARLFGMPAREATRVGLGMISRGEVGLIVAAYGLAHGLITADIFSAAVIMVLVTTVITPPALRLTFPKRGQSPHPVVEETVAGTPEVSREAP
jgi:Kef-type K+ transport system membrane component KefB